MVCVYRVGDGARIMSFSLEDTVGGIDWHPNCQWLAAADMSGAVQLLDTETGQARPLGRHKAQAVLAEFSPDGDFLLTAGWEQEFYLVGSAADGPHVYDWVDSYQGNCGQTEASVSS